MADRVISVGDNLTLPASVIVPAAQVTGVSPATQTALNLKANASSLSAKADTATVDAALSLKANTTSLAAKADTATVNAALALRVSGSDYRLPYRVQSRAAWDIEPAPTGTGPFWGVST